MLLQGLNGPPKPTALLLSASLTLEESIPCGVPDSIDSPGEVPGSQPKCVQSLQRLSGPENPHSHPCLQKCKDRLLILSAQSFASNSLLFVEIMYGRSRNRCTGGWSDRKQAILSLLADKPSLYTAESLAFHLAMGCLTKADFWGNVCPIPQGRERAHSHCTAHSAHLPSEPFNNDDKERGAGLPTEPTNQNFRKCLFSLLYIYRIMELKEDCRLSFITTQHSVKKNRGSHVYRIYKKLVIKSKTSIRMVFVFFLSFCPFFSSLCFNYIQFSFLPPPPFLLSLSFLSFIFLPYQCPLIFSFLSLFPPSFSFLNTE